MRHREEVLVTKALRQFSPSVSRLFGWLTQIIKFLVIFTTFLLGSIVEQNQSDAHLHTGDIDSTEVIYISPTFSNGGTLDKIICMLSFFLQFFHHLVITSINSFNLSVEKTTSPEKTVGRCGCNLRTNSVQTPKFEPPPRIPQNSSAFSVLLRVSVVPSAVTRVACVVNPLNMWIRVHHIAA